MNRTFAMTLALVGALALAGAAADENTMIHELAQETRQPVGVVRNLLRSFPPAGGRTLEQARTAYKVILQTYTIDALTETQARRCNGYLALVSAGRSTVASESNMARDCPTLWRYVSG